MSAAIALQGLVKSYGRIKAVDGVGFTVAPGEFVGLVGPNGAGKSTTIKILTGQLLPTAGSVLVGGHDVVADPAQARSRIGYVPEFPDLYDYLSAREMIRFVIELRGGVIWSGRLRSLGWARMQIG